MKLRKTNLGELIRIRQGFAFKSSNYVPKSKYRLVTLGNFSNDNSFKFNNSKATYYDGDFPEEVILKKDDLILPLTEQVKGLLGNSAFIPESFDYSFVLNQRVGKIICNDKNASKLFIHYLLATDLVKNQLEAMAHGTRQHNISPDDIYKVTVFVPSLSNQKKIGKALYNLENRISNNNAISKELELMAKTIYDYWFLQFEFPDKDGNPYKSNGGKMVWNDQLKQKIPEEWEVSTVENILGDYPKTKTIKSKNYDQGSIYPIIDQSKDTYICGFTDDKTKVLELTNAIVFGDHSNVSKYVNFPFARGADGTQILNSNTLRLPNYLLYQEITSLPEIEKGYSRHFKFLKMQNVIIPTLDISKKYISTVENMLYKQKQIIFENKELESLRDFLLPLLMNGQVTIED